MASSIRLRCFAQFLSSSLSQRINYSVKRCEKYGCSYFPFWLSPPRRNISAWAEFPSSLSPPLLLLPPEEVNANNKNHERVVNIPLFSLADNQVVKLRNRILPEEISDAHLVGSSHGWLAYVNGRKCGMYVANIFSPSVSPQIIQLPTIETLPGIKDVVRDSSSNVVKQYTYHNSPQTPERLSWLLITKLAMSSPPNNNNCTVMIADGILQHLSFCRIGDTSWTPLEHHFEPGFIEIIYSNKDHQFYALTQDGNLEAWDLRDPTSPKRNLIEAGYEFPESYLSKSEIDLRDLCYKQEYLVELSGGDILFVDRYLGFVGEDGTYVDVNTSRTNLPYRTARFDIFKVEFEKENAEYVTSIGDNALFLGYNHSFSLFTRDYPHLKPNSVYFVDNCQEYFISNFIFEKKSYRYGGHDTGVYSLEDNSVTPLYHPFEFNKILLPPIWVFPGKD